MSGQEAKDMGFATEVKSSEVKALAMYNAKNKSKTKKQMKKKKTKDESIFAKMFALLQDHLDARAEVTLQDSDGDEITFPDVEEGATPAVGDKGTIDGAPVPDGTYVMPSLGNASITFEGGEITMIEENTVEKEETTEEEVQDKVNARLKVVAMANVKAEELLQISVWPIESSSTSFNVGDKVTYVDWDDNEVAVSAGEYQREDGTRIVTDASGVIVDVKTKEESTDPTIDGVEAKEIQELTSRLEAQAKEITELKKMINSPTINAMGNDQPQGKEENIAGAGRYFKFVNKKNK